MRELADADRIRRLMQELGREPVAGARVYFTDGATAVLYGWRESTIDVDMKIVPELDSILRALPRLKERLRINVELASPGDFVPVPAGWEERSPFISREGRVNFHHFDPYAQALAKVERAREYFESIEEQLYRSPAVDPEAFRRAVEEAFG